LYVLDGDNDLREAVTLDLVNLDSQGSPDNVNVVAQLYRGELRWGPKTFLKKLKQLGEPDLPPAVKNDWRGMKVFEVRHRDDGSVTREADYSRPSSSPNDPNALEDYLVWAMRKFPAKHYAVILGGHGSPDGVLPDGRGNFMPFNETGEVLRRVAERTGARANVIVLDACSTSGSGTAQALQGAGDYLVASPVPIRGPGWSEQLTLQALSGQDEVSPEQLARSFLAAEHHAVPEVHVYDLADGSLKAKR
jgi:hypothetical protein